MCRQFDSVPGHSVREQGGSAGAPGLDWLIEDEPVQFELPDGLRERGEADGCLDEPVGAEIVAAELVTLLVAGRQNDDRLNQLERRAEARNDGWPGRA